MTLIVNLNTVAGRLFALGLDSKEIADALSLSESTVCDALAEPKADGGRAS
ncbi:MAG: hypothetical protein ABL893_05915 [Hyphomicrobium sp.]